MRFWITRSHPEIFDTYREEDIIEINTLQELLKFMREKAIDADGENCDIILINDSSCIYSPELEKFIANGVEPPHGEIEIYDYYRE